VPLADEFSALPIGRAEIRRPGGSGLALLAFGCMLSPALVLGERLNATVVNMRFVKPLDATMLLELAATHAGLITLEDNAVAGGAGSACAELLHVAGLSAPMLHIGIPDRFIEHGSREDCLREAGLDVAGIAATIERWCGVTPGLKPVRAAPKLAAAGSAAAGPIGFPEHR
jgi:1-deoxy-D-xylulose-5-phosphate synthase